jgi:hypothetical protein
MLRMGARRRRGAAGDGAAGPRLGTTIEVLSGLSPDDVVILSDMSQDEGLDRVRLR